MPLALFGERGASSRLHRTGRLIRTSKTGNLKGASGSEVWRRQDFPLLPSSWDVPTNKSVCSMSSGRNCEGGDIPGERVVALCRAPVCAGCVLQRLHSEKRMQPRGVDFWPSGSSGLQSLSPPRMGANDPLLAAAASHSVRLAKAGGGGGGTRKEQLEEEEEEGCEIEAPVGPPSSLTFWPSWKIGWECHQSLLIGW
jgi:hypothetical protein